MIHGRKALTGKIKQSNNQRSEHGELACLLVRSLDESFSKRIMNKTR